MSVLKKDWKKNLFRGKQLIDQGLGRAEKSEVLSEDLQNLDKRVENIRNVLKTTHGKLSGCIQQGAGPDVEKRLRKMPEFMLGHSMIESATHLGIETLMGQMFQMCGDATGKLAQEKLQHEMEVEKKVLSQLHLLLENEIPHIQKQRKVLNKLTLDMDSAKGRYHSAQKQGQSGHQAKMGNLKDEMEEASQKVEQSKDQYATDMFSFVSREPEFSQYLLELVQSQATYHRKALEIIERLVPQMQEQVEHAPQIPVYGTSLEEHLRRTNRDIAVVLEVCCCTLLEIGMKEEGLFRVAGASSKVKKLKAAFDSNLVEMDDFIRDIHCVSGALKLYLRELPEPLMTFELYDEWMQAAYLPQDQRLQAYWVVLDRLPKNNYKNLRYLIKFCAKLAEKQDINKMSPSNIAIVIGPNLLWPPGDGGPTVLSTGTQSAILEALIYHHEYFFPGEEDFGVSGSSSGGSPILPPSNDVNSEPLYVATPVYGLATMASPQALSPSTASAGQTSPATTSSPPSSHYGSHNSLTSHPPMMPGSDGSLNRRYTKKPPAPLPPAPSGPGPSAPAERPYVAEATPQLLVSPPTDKHGSDRPPIPERPQAPPPGPPADKPQTAEKPTSPRSERPSGPPPARPQGPPPEKPAKPDILHRRQGSNTPDVVPSKSTEYEVTASKTEVAFKPEMPPPKPDLPPHKPDVPPSKPESIAAKPDLLSAKPDVSQVKGEPSSGKPEKPELPPPPSFQRSGSGRPPRPQPPPPPPPGDRRPSAGQEHERKPSGTQEPRAPLAEDEDDTMGMTDATEDTRL